ncbi:MAG: hypothetical protein KC414_05415, partial [Romboutsia sp.]|nr:hypothetical protein [Romboutsia sp.]
LLLSIIIASCATPKPGIVEIPEQDNQTPIFYSGNEVSFKLNGDLLYKLNSFGSTDVLSSEGKLHGTKLEVNNIFNNPFGEFDYSYSLEPSLSFSGRYLAKANDDFSLFSIRFNRNVDVDIVESSNLENIYTYTLTLPKTEYKEEKYQIPWSLNDDGFFGLLNDSLYKFYPSDKSSIQLLAKDGINYFSVSQSEKYIAICTSDSLFIYQMGNNNNDLSYSIYKSRGIDYDYIKMFSWFEDESKLSFTSGWSIIIYDIQNDKIEELDVGGKVFSLEWIDKNQLLFVSGEYPSDMSSMQSNKNYSINVYSFLSKKYFNIHSRINHEPFSVKPRLSPSKKLILFSEKKLNGPYQVKLMSLDGKNENILSEGYLPFWGNIYK